MNVIESNRNEERSQYYEKIFAAIEFSKLLRSEEENELSHIEIKPDRKDGIPRRIEDITLHKKDKSVHVMQLKYSDVPGSEWTYSGLWDKKKTAIKKSQQRSSKHEGKEIYKFYKSWKFHRDKQKRVKLFLVSNKPLGNDLGEFFIDIQYLNTSSLDWVTFSNKYKTQLEDIKANLTGETLKRNELKNFIQSFEFIQTPSIEELDLVLSDELKKYGVIDRDRVDAFWKRTFQIFTQKKIEIRQADVNALLQLIKLGLIHEIKTPENYLKRERIFRKIIDATETLKKDGGFVLLFAPSGSGKTVTLSEITRTHPDFIPYMCRIRAFEKNDSQPHHDKERLSSRWFKIDLIQRLHELGLVTESVSSEDHEIRVDAIFNRALRELSENALKRRSRKIVIIVDALDQVATDRYDKAKSLLHAIPTDKYPGLVFLLSTWGKEYLPDNLSGSEIEIELAFEKSEISEYFKQADINLTVEQLTKIHKKTGGLAISIFYMLQKLRNLKQQQYDKLLDENFSYHEVFDWYEPIWQTLNQAQKNTLGYLSIHKAEITRSTLFSIAKTPLGKFNELNQKISPFVSVNSGYIQPYHDSFRRFVIGKLKSEEKRFIKKIIDFYSKKDNRKLLYTKKFLASHLKEMGANDDFSKKLSTKLVSAGFIDDILNSKIALESKFESVEYFLNFLMKQNDIERFIKYSFKLSSLDNYVDKDDIYLRARIGTDTFVSEIEMELSKVETSSIHAYRDWVQKRIGVGCIFFKSDNLTTREIGLRFIEEGVARISYNDEILYDKDLHSDQYWRIWETYLRGLVNLGRYDVVTNYIKGIRYEKNSPSSVSHRANLLSAVNYIQYGLDKKKVLNTINHLPPGVQVSCYFNLYKYFGDTVAKDELKKLVKNASVFRYIVNESDKLELLKFIYSENTRGKKSLIKKIVNTIKADVPYFSNPMSHWGIHGKSTFVKKFAFLSLLDKDFNIENEYRKCFIKKYKGDKSNEEKENTSFTQIFVLRVDLHKAILELSATHDWKSYRLKVKSIFIKFFEKFQGLTAENLNQYPYRESVRIYHENFFTFANEALLEINKISPQKTHLILSDFESLFSNTLVGETQYYHEFLLEHTLPITDELSDRISVLTNLIFKLKAKNQQSSYEKSAEFKDLAKTILDKGYRENAEKIYKHSLRYSQGLSPKEDFRLYNLIDCLKYQRDINQFDVVLDYINKAGVAMESSWYFKLMFIDSAAYYNLELAYRYLYDLSNTGSVNLNEGIKKVILSRLKVAKYEENIPELLPLVDLLHFKEETGSKDQENVQIIYHELISYLCANNDFSSAKALIKKYTTYLKRFVYIKSQLTLLEDLLTLISSEKELSKEAKVIRAYINSRLVDGYTFQKDSSNSIEIVTKDEVREVINSIERNSTKKLISALSVYIAEGKRYKAEKLAIESIPYLKKKEFNIVKKWCENNELDKDYQVIIAFLKAALTNGDAVTAKELRKKILLLCRQTDRLYYLDSIINDVAKIEFTGKRTFIRKIILHSIERAARSNNYLNSIFLRSSEVISMYYPELKSYAYKPLKENVEAAMKLSLSNK